MLSTFQLITILLTLIGGVVSAAAWMNNKIQQAIRHSDERDNKLYQMITKLNTDLLVSVKDISAKLDHYVLRTECEQYREKCPCNKNPR